MDLRLTFNSDPMTYNNYRPTYPKELFDDLIKYSNLDKNKSSLEIGIGTGQASRPILETGCELTAIEIGNDLAEFTRLKFKDYNNLNVINDDFEKVDLESNAFDFIYSASAFHWIPLDMGLLKVLKLLKSGGVFAWFAFRPSPALEHAHIHDSIQNVYSKYNEYFNHFTNKLDLETIQLNAKERLNSRSDIFKEYSFTDVQTFSYKGERTIEAEDYIKLISTFSDHKAIPKETREKFLNEIKESINKFGGSLKMSDTIILCMGRKK